MPTLESVNVQQNASYCECLLCLFVSMFVCVVGGVDALKGTRTVFNFWQSCTMTRHVGVVLAIGVDVNKLECMHFGSFEALIISKSITLTTRLLTIFLFTRYVLLFVFF